MKKELPLCLENSIPTECWSFYRFAIIEAYPHLLPWTVQHYQHIFSNYGWELFHGKNGEKYNQLSYYDDVLTTIGLSHADVPSFMLNSFIKKNIDKGIYPLIECDYSMLSNTDPGYAHEVLVYGYDDESQTFMCPILKYGKWKTELIEYSKFQEAYARFDSLSNETVRTNLYRRAYLYPITLLEPKKHYCTSYSLSLLYMDVNDILYQAYQIYDTYNTGDDSICPSYYGWLGVYNALLIAGRRILVDEEFRKEYRYSTNLNRLYVYRVRFDKNLHLILSQSEVPYDEGWFELGKESARELQCCVKMAIKYDQTGDKRHIMNIQDLLVSAIRKDQQVLDRLSITLREWLVSHY